MLNRAVVATASLVESSNFVNQALDQFVSFSSSESSKSCVFSGENNVAIAFLYDDRRFSDTNGSAKSPNLARSRGRLGIGKAGLESGFGIE